MSTGFGELFCVEAWLLPGDQHDSEASFVSHHPSVSFGGIGQRNRFDHRTDLLQGAKGKRVILTGGNGGNREETSVISVCSCSIGSGDNKLAPKAFGAGRVEQVLRAARE